MLLPRQRAKLARGAKDKEHAMSQTPKIALANKLARIAWSVLARGRAFEARKIDQAANQSA